MKTKHKILIAKIIFFIISLFRFKLKVNCRRNNINWNLDLSEAILNNEFPFLDITDGATFYHADYVNPSWAKTKLKTIEIEDHIFYRW